MAPALNHLPEAAAVTMMFTVPAIGVAS